MKNRIIIIFIISILACGVIATPLINRYENIKEFSNEDSLVLWSSSFELTWDHFQGQPNETSELKLHDAVTYTTMGFRNYLEFEDSLKVDYCCFFLINRSWVKTPNDQLLKHEQGHFDIAELHARMIRKNLFGRSFDSFNSCMIFVKEIVDSLAVKKSEMQDLYDQETNFSKDSVNQLKWDDMIEKHLLNYNEYESTQLIMYW